MTADQYEQLIKTIDRSIEVSIEKNVNGKIKRLDEKIDIYIERDNQWKDDVMPAIEGMKQVQGFTNVGAVILKGIILIGSATGLVYGLFVFLGKWIRGL